MSQTSDLPNGHHTLNESATDASFTTETGREDRLDTTKLGLSDEGNPIDKLVSKIGIGRYHYIIYVVVGIFYLCDGAEIIAISFMNVTLEDYWTLTHREVGSIGTVIFAGFFIGSLISGHLTDLFGRKKLYLIGVFFTFVTALISAFAPTFTVMLIARGFYGAVIGVLMPLAATILAEVSPNRIRGKVMVVVSSLFTFGELMACGVAAITLTSTNVDGWRWLLVWVAIPAGISFIVGLIFILESPRYAIFKDFNFGISILNQISRINKKDEINLSSEEAKRMEGWIHNQKEAMAHTEGYKALISPQNRNVSTKLWFMWFVLSFVYYGIVYVFPMVLAAESTDMNNSTEDIGSVFVSILGEIPSAILCYFLIEHTSYGRKNSMIVSFGCAGLACWASWFCDGYLLTLLMFIAKFFANAAFAFIYPYTSEVYHTKYRTTGLGVASAMSRIGGMLMPVITLACFNITPKFPFVIYGILCIGAAITSWLLPYDTRGRELDKVMLTTEASPNTTQELHTMAIA